MLCHCDPSALWGAPLCASFGAGLPPSFSRPPRIGAANVGPGPGPQRQGLGALPGVGHGIRWAPPPPPRQVGVEAAPPSPHPHLSKLPSLLLLLLSPGCPVVLKGPCPSLGRHRLSWSLDCFQFTSVFEGQPVCSFTSSVFVEPPGSLEGGE
ncbi:unnamed protein product [Rangifer tarandus platyrhynchus]|uniref:Uncharacterized protein n=2 Tax=Rangifer tarandus platyrhynchus TaxID=3082113 RepID=A0AC59ZIU7_RANTA|nr:unnamed protein product [Rangifer tarandus platyrhynchus]